MGETRTGDMAVRTGGLVQVCPGVYIFFSSSPDRSTAEKLAPSDLVLVKDKENIKKKRPIIHFFNALSLELPLLFYASRPFTLLAQDFTYLSKLKTPSLVTFGLRAYSESTDTEQLQK